MSLLKRGAKLNWDIDCNALTGKDISALATIIGEIFTFTRVIGVKPTGIKFAKELEKHCRRIGSTLIADSVFIDGAVMEEIRKSIEGPVIGVVIFARRPCPNWIFPIFTVEFDKYFYF